MSLSLKDMNRPALVVVVIANIVIYFTVLNDFDFSKFSSLMANYESYVPGALIAIIVGVLNSQISPTAKARLVFWRWHNPLPGSRAFTEIMFTDDRIDPAVLRSIVDPLPTEPAEQNRLWYKWYREVQDETGIRQVHREFLFTRDWAGLSILFGITLVPLAYWQLGKIHALILLVVMAVQYLAVRWSARNHGRRFVASVLACKSSADNR